MNPYRSLRLLYSHPYNRQNPVNALFRFSSWHVRKRLGRTWVAPLWGGRKAIFFPDSRESMWLAYNHVMDWNEFAFMTSFLRAADIALDVGANIGVYALWLSNCIDRSGRIIAFEPDPENFRRLNEQLKLNCLDWIKTERLALAATDGVVRFSQGEDMENHLVLDPVIKRHRTSDIEVRCLSMATYCSEQNLERIHFLKIDVEGAELFVLQGASELLRNKIIDVIQFEVNEQVKNFGCHRNDVWDFLNAFGYSVFRYESDTSALRNVAPGDIEHGSHRNLLALHDEDLVGRRLRSR
jgi:FkbM family methyltransferase